MISLLSHLDHLMNYSEIHAFKCKDHFPRRLTAHFPVHCCSTEWVVVSAITGRNRSVSDGHAHMHKLAASHWFV